MNWRYKIELNKALTEMSEKYDLERHEEPCPKEVKEALASEIKKAWPLQRFCQKILDAKSIAQVNRILENVWNAADTERVWCGL
jgi:hypothetical protein